MSDAARKIAVIVALDVAGYSARTEADEAKTTAEVAALRQVIEDIAKAHGGRVFNTAGDGFMLEFASSLAAVEAAGDLVQKCEPKVRVGVHLGDVMVQPNGDLLGHGVNVAARLMAKSDPGAALISADVRRTIRGPLAERLVSRGPMQLDKMAETIEAFALGVAASLPAASPKPSEPVLAVLPFDNLSDDREMQFFSDGVSEEILHTVARAQGLRVIGRSSSFQFRGADKAVRKVASELQATHILDGSVRRAGGHIRVTAHLVEAASQTTLWTDRYDRDLTDVLKVQDELAAAIADALNGKLVQRLQPHAIDPAAFDFYLRARSVLASDWLESEKRRAVVLLEEAVARAPDFARAWGMLAMARVFLLPIGRDMIGERDHVAALRAAERALALDSNCPEAYSALAMLKPAFSNYAEKIRLANKSVALAPNDAWLTAMRGELLLSVGRTEDCIDAYARCVQLEPSVMIFRAGYAAYLGAASRVDEAMQIVNELSARHPNSPLLWMMRWTAAFANGRVEEAERMVLPQAQLPTGVTRADADSFLPILQLRKVSAAQRESMLRAALQPGVEANLHLTDCLIAADCGQVDLAFEVLLLTLDANRPIGNRGVGSWGQRRAMTGAVLFGFQGRALRRDPRFAVLCARLGLVNYWRESGQWPDCVNAVPYDFKAECEKAWREVTKI
jgi:adenylate cyclase